MPLKELIKKHNITGYICLDDEYYDNYSYRWEISGITRCRDWSDRYIPDCFILEHGLYFSILHPAFILAHNCWRLDRINVYQIEAYGAYRLFFLEDYYNASCLFRAPAARIVRKLERDEINYDESLYLRNDRGKTEEKVRRWLDYLGEHPELSLTEIADRIHLENCSEPRIKPAYVTPPFNVLLTDKRGRKKPAPLFNGYGPYVDIGLCPGGVFKYYIEHRDEFLSIAEDDFLSFFYHIFYMVKYDRHDYKGERCFDLYGYNSFTSSELDALIRILEDEIRLLEEAGCDVAALREYNSETFEAFAARICYYYNSNKRLYYINRDLFAEQIEQLKSVMNVILKYALDAGKTGWIFTVMGI